MDQFPVDLTESAIRTLLNSEDSYTRRFYDAILTLKELNKKGVIQLENKYESLRKHHVPADFLFIVMRNTFNLSSDTPMMEIFLLNSYKALQRISQPPEQYLGIDRNALQIEYIALK